MKILMVGPSRNSMGGMATVINNFSVYFKHNDINIEYFESWKEGSFLFRIKESVLCNFRLISLIKKNNIDIVHIHMAQKGSFYRKSILLLISRILKCKTILHIHGSHFDKFYNEGNCISKKYIKFILNSSNEIIVLSQEWKNFVQSITHSNIIILHNAVYVSERKYENEGKNITFLGRLGKRKGIYDILSILEDINLEENNLKLYLCGDGDIEEVIKCVKKLKLDEYVIVTGWINKEQKETILKDTIINILPSYHEGMPMAILETMAKGIPNISTTVGGIPQVIENLKDGIIIKPGDKEALKESINLMIEDDKLRKEMGINAYNKIRKEYSIESYNKRVVNIYYDLMRG